MKRRDKFDYIMVETTGMADPGPVAQTFYVDDDMQEKLKLDAIVTMVDAKHIWEHIDDSDEAKEQVAFADVILLNKIDLVAPEDLDRLEARIKSINSMAKIFRTRDAVVEMDQVLNVGRLQPRPGRWRSTRSSWSRSTRLNGRVSMNWTAGLTSG